MNGYPVIIRLIDPPLHEFMPDEEALLEEVITMRVKGETEGLAEKESLLAAIRNLHESNPMMGLRGVRLSHCHAGNRGNAGARHLRAPRRIAPGAALWSSRKS